MGSYCMVKPLMVIKRRYLVVGSSRNEKNGDDIIEKTTVGINNATKRVTVKNFSN
jgi:hypothetical protein